MWDQTDNQWLLGSPEERGTGIYLFPNPQPNDPYAAHKVFDQDITYQECRESGDVNGALAIKWIPHAIASFALLNSTPCGTYCKDTCVQFGCVCNSKKHVCE
jgi:hypothetical protein